MSARFGAWLATTCIALAACLAYGKIVDQFDSASLFRVLIPGALGVAGILMVLLSPSVVTLKRSVLFIWLPAVLLRLALFPAAVSDDVNRYLWEGQLVASGISPYAHTADAEEWVERRDVYWEGMNNRDKLTAYPPLSELTFGAIAALAYHPLSFKVAFTLADLLTLAGVLALLSRRGLNPAFAGLYAFNPLVLLSFAAEAHFDALMLAPLVWAVWFYDTGRVHWAVAMASIASGIKWVTLPLVPFFARRKLPRGALVSMLVFLLPAVPFWETLPSLISGLVSFGGTRSFNGPVYDLIHLGLALPRSASTVIVGSAFLAILVWRWLERSQAGIDAQIRWVLGALVILSPTVHFWYLAWVVPFVALRPSLPWVTFSITSGLYFLVWANESWGLLLWQQWALWLPFFLAAGYEVWSTRGAVLFSARRERSDDPSITVVIPTLNAGGELPKAFASIEKQDIGASEVIIADAGSSDDTRALVAGSELPIRIVEAPKGRGQQIAAGIDAAGADWVVVLHGDCILPDGAFATLTAAIYAHPDVLGGAFGQRFEDSSIELLPIELLNDARALFSRTAFGDQIQFFHRASVVKHDLFPKQPLMEDVESSWRLREMGEFLFLGQPGRSSRQKWSRQGWSKRFRLVVGLVARYRLARRKGRARAERLSRDLYEEYYSPKS